MLAHHVQDALPAELDVKVLTTGFWPTHSSPKLVLPEDMAKCVKAFEDFYSSSTKHRNITWMHNLVRPPRHPLAN